MKDYETLKKIWEAETPDNDARPCFCVGPQNGNPLCPCQMRNRLTESRKVTESRKDWLEGFEAGRKSRDAEVGRK